jgi:septum formation protein
VPFAVRPTDVEELERGDPAEVAVENALRKARAAHLESAAGEPETILGVDTLVTLGERIYGKPASASAARETIAALVGQTHTVLSGVALLREDREHVALARTEVVFRECDEQLVDWYVDSGEWREKSGGYAIQGLGSVLVREIRGNYENVVGLPLATLLDLCPELLRARLECF